MTPVWPDFKFGPCNLWTMPPSNARPALKLRGPYWCGNLPQGKLVYKICKSVNLS